MESFGSRLSAARKSRGWKQPELAAASGVDQGAISRYERDLAEPLLSKANLLAKALEIPIEYLLGESTVNKVVIPPPDPWPVWAKQLRDRYSAADEATQAVMAADIRRLWPRPVAEKILAWLRTDPS